MIKIDKGLKLWKALRASIGVSSAAEWLKMQLYKEAGLGEPQSWSVRPLRIPYPVTMRLRGSSDWSVFRQIFVSEEYAPLLDLKSPSVILDLGANIGYSSAFFLGCFPECRVLAVEPDTRNFEVCQQNLKAYGDRAIPLHGAAWWERARLNLSTGSFGDGREWATQVELPQDGTTGEVEAWDMQSLIDMTGSTTIDLLKVDVERAEIELFGRNAEQWLPYVRNICIELHGKDCEDAFFGALSNFDYELSHSDELTICRNLRAKIASRTPVEPTN